MTLALLFWVLWIVGLLFGGYRQRNDIGTWASDTLLWILLGLLGWATFGGLIK